MNAAYVYDSHEASYLIANRIYYLLETKHWSVKTLSDESNIPYETLKKLLSRKTEHTSFHNIMKIALAFQCNLNYLVEPLGEMDLSFQPSGTVTPRFPDTIDDDCDNCKFAFSKPSVPLLHPDTLSDMDIPKYASQVDTVDISSYPCHIRQEVAFGVQVSSCFYHPAYSEKDILLISRRRPPLPGETGVFFHNGKIYIRSFFKNFDSVILKSVNGIGPDIQIFDLSEWTIGGYVIGVQKANRLFHF